MFAWRRLKVAELLGIPILRKDPILIRFKDRNQLKPAEFINDFNDFDDFNESDDFELLCGFSSCSSKRRQLSVLVRSSVRLLQSTFSDPPNAPHQVASLTALRLGLRWPTLPRLASSSRISICVLRITATNCGTLSIRRAQHNRMGLSKRRLMAERLLKRLKRIQWNFSKHFLTVKFSEGMHHPQAFRRDSSEAIRKAAKLRIARS